MKIIELEQGSDAWLAWREGKLTATGASAVMGCSPYASREELISEAATGIRKDNSDKQWLFDKGHAAEALGRPIAEQIIGEELYPACVEDGEYAASLDGLTMDGSVIWECKAWNEKKATRVRAGYVPEQDYWQCVHQLMICGERLMYMVTDGERQEHCWMESAQVQGDIARLRQAWAQFDKDVAEWKPTPKTVEAVGVRPDNLPALFIEVTGQLSTTSNLAEFRAGAEMLIGSIKTELVTDQDFADADAAIKWLAETEKRIDAQIEGALARTGPLEELVRTLRDVKENLCRTTRLRLNNKVSEQKVNRRNQIVSDAELAYGTFLRELNNELNGSGVSLTVDVPDFYAAIKGKRSFDSMVGACNDAIAAGKIAANEQAAKVRRNLALLDQHAEHAFLFPNKQQLVGMDHDHLELTIKTKISDYQAKKAAEEAARIEADRARIRAEEQARADREAAERQAQCDAGTLEAMRALEAEGAVCKPAAPIPTQYPANVTKPAATSIRPAPGHKDRPSDDDIIQALADRFGVTESAVAGWILDMDTEALRLAA